MGKNNLTYSFVDLLMMKVELERTVWTQSYIDKHTHFIYERNLHRYKKCMFIAT